MTSSIYLTGSTIEPIERLGQVSEPDWRTLAMTKLQRYGLKVLNPLELSWSAVDQEAGLEQRVRRELDLINQCDAVLANLVRAGYGTAMEIFYAYRHGKMVTVVGQSPFSPWVLSHSQARFPDIDHALNYLIGEQPQLDSITLALQHESAFCERYEQFPPDGEPDYQFLGGELPVLVVAPHATAFFRDGEFHEPDSLTGAMAALLHRLSGAHVLVSSYCCVADPCWHLETPMVRALADIVKAGQMGLVVLLLGLPWHDSPGLHVSGQGLDEANVEDLSCRLRLRLGALEPVAVDQGDNLVLPLTRFISESLAVPVLSVKMHKRYRMPRLQPALFAQVVELLSSFIGEAGLELLRSRS